jgi:hypothetical protein
MGSGILTEPARITEGRRVIAEGELRPLRETLALTRGAMADLLATDVATYTTWESKPGTKLWKSTAARVGVFYRSATRSLALLADEGVDLSVLLPLHVAATETGVPQEVLLRWHREGWLTGEDLGVLGLWVRRDDLAELTGPGY